MAWCVVGLDLFRVVYCRSYTLHVPFYNVSPQLLTGKANTDGENKPAKRMVFTH